MANSRTYRRWFAAFIVGLVALTFAVSFSLINSRLRSAYFTPVPGHLKPVWSVTDLKGRTWTSASLRGKIVVLDFWATWCSPCRREMPILNKLQHEYASRGVQVIGLSVDDTPNTPALIKHFIKDQGIDYPIAPAPPDLDPKLGGIGGIPTAFYIDRDGVVRYRQTGAATEANLRKVFNAMLDDGPPPSK